MADINYNELRKGIGGDGLFYRTGEKDPFTGEAAIWYKDGQLKFHAVYKDGLLHGKSTWWFRNGKVEYEAQYDQGIRVD